MTWTHIVEQQHGMVSVDQAVAAGIGRRAIERRVADGLWQRAFPGVLWLSQASPDRDARQWGALLSLPDGAALSHLDAADVWGLGVVLTQEIHITVSRNTHPRPRHGVVIHRSRFFTPSEVVIRRDLPVTRLERTIVDVHELLGGDADRRAFVADIFRRRLTTQERLLSAVARTDGLRRKRELLAAVALAAGGSHSRPEMDFAEWLTGVGLGPIERQFAVLLQGRRRYLDACDPVLRINYEIDGAHHRRVDQHESDLRRDAALLASNWVVVRLTDRRLRTEPEVVATEIRALIAQRREMLAAGLITPAERAA